MRMIIMAAAGLLIATPVQAQNVTAANPQSIVQALQGAGYKALVDKDSSGDPRIESGASGARWFVYFYGCKNGANCTTVTFRAGWSDTQATTAKLNEWNRDRRFSRAYLDKENDPMLEFDVDLDDGGMSRALFIDNVEYWEASLAAFRNFIR